MSGQSSHLRTSGQALPTGQHGFTLLELLIALALIGMMVLLLFGALRFSSKAWDLSEKRLERDTTIGMVWQYLGDRFSRARNLHAHVKSEGKSYFFFQGAEQALEFVSPMPARLGSGGLYILRLQRVRRDRRDQLILRRWLYHPEVLAGEAGLPQWRPVRAASPFQGEKEKPELRAWYSESVLVDEMKKLKFAYYGLQEAGDDHADWSDTWEDRKTLPLLVRMQLADAQGEWPQMTFELPGY